MSAVSSPPTGTSATSIEMDMTDIIDRSTDISQPLDRLGPDETLKAHSDYLGGTIDTSLLERISGGVRFEDNKLMKFHGIYQQDDRDIRDERRRQRLEPAFTFMVRVRLPGGVCTPEQWLKIDELARAHGGDTIRLTTRQTFQFHWVVKEDLRPTIQGLHDVLLDTVAACGDDSRGVMSTADPRDSALHAEVASLAKSLSDHVIPKTGAYHEICYGKERVATSEEEEPFYGRTYMPRKFKIGFVVPPSNDIDVYTQDLGLIVVPGPDGSVEGFNVAIGGGMGRSDQDAATYPRLADVVGYIPKARLVEAADAVMSVQRDYGNRVDRSRARFKYTIDDKGLGFITAEIERRMGAPFEPARPFAFTSNGDLFGWRGNEDGSFNFTLFILSGRVANRPGKALMDALREIARDHRGKFRLTPNQNLIVADVPAGDRARIEAILAAHGIVGDGVTSLRRNAIACVALPTCPLAMAEAERYLPDFTSKLEAILAANGLADEPLTMRISGCPNGCSRPYVAEIALTGRAPGKYNLWLGAGFHGERLNSLVLDNAGEAAILVMLGETIGRWARERTPGEHFGDFLHRSGFFAAEAAA